MPKNQGSGCPSVQQVRVSCMPENDANSYALSDVISPPGSVPGTPESVETPEQMRARLGLDTSEGDALMRAEIESEAQRAEIGENRRITDESATGGGSYSKQFDMADAESTRNLVQGTNTVVQLQEMAGQTAVQMNGQVQQLRAQQDASMRASYEAAASSARFAAGQQMISATASMIAAGVLGGRASEHGNNIQTAKAGAARATDIINSTDAGQRGTGIRNGGVRSSQDGYVNFGGDLANQAAGAAADLEKAKKFSSAYGEKFKLDQKYYYRSGVDLCSGTTLRTYEARSRSLYQAQIAGMQPAQQQQFIQQKAAEFCRQEQLAKRNQEHAQKQAALTSDVNRIKSHVISEQEDGKRHATDAMTMQLMQGAVKLVQGSAMLAMASEYEKLANKVPDVNRPPDIDTSFDPLAAGGADAPRGGGTVTGGGSNDSFAAGGDDEQIEEELAQDLGKGFDGTPPSREVAGAPEATGLKDIGGGGGGGGGVGGLNGGSTSPASSESGGGDSDAAQFAALGYGGGKYGGCGAAYGGGGGGRRGDSGNSGIDLNSLLGQFLPGAKEEKKDDSFVDFGGRAPASAGESLLDRNVDIFQRIHNAYQERGRKGVVGN